MSRKKKSIAALGAAIAERLAAIFDAATIDPRRRGETLPQQEFLALGAAL